MYQDLRIYQQFAESLSPKAYFNPIFDPSSLVSLTLFVDVWGVKIYPKDSYLVELKLRL